MVVDYRFQYEQMEFSKDGQLDELIALDRYAVPSYTGYKIGDVVVAIVDEVMGSKKICTITNFIDSQDTIAEVIDRLGEKHVVKTAHMHKPLELKPAQMWERWAKGGASVEKPELQKNWENNFRWLMDGYGYSLGGRIQLMLGQEYVTGEKANLTAYNCYVSRSPKSLYDIKKLSINGLEIIDEGGKKAIHVHGFSDGALQFLEVLTVARIEANIMRRGGGVGINISAISTVEGSKCTEDDFLIYIDESHMDAEEFKNRMKLGKFKGVTVTTSLYEYKSYLKQLDAYEIVGLDDVNGLFDNMNDMVIESYKGKKIAVNLNQLRERNALVKGVNGRSSGSVSWGEMFVLIANLLQNKTIDNVDFAEIYSFMVGLIQQGGSRRGALMLICSDDNENVYKFMERKKEKDEFGKGKWLTGANISVGISDTFMKLVKEGKTLSKEGLPLKLKHEHPIKLWDILIQSAWESAEPGIVWMERYNKESNSWYFHPIVCTNPCGEQGLPEFGVCNLGHLVLPRYYNPETNDVDWDRLARAVRIAVRLQDNIIDYTKYFLSENEVVQKRERRVGIGSLGLGTLMIKMGLRYGKDNEFVDKLYKFIAYHAYDASMDIAEEKGAFPAYEYDKHIQSGFMQKLLAEFPDLHEKLKRTGIRNVTILTQAPTGSTGTYIDNIPLFRLLFGGTTTGIEPYFSWEYWRAGRLGMSKQTVPLAGDWLVAHGFEREQIDKLPEYFVTAMDLEPEDHVRVQAAVQKWTDSSISKTANCPSDYSIEQTDELYMMSYDLGLKGMTIYRDGSRSAQVLAVKEEDAKLEFHIEAQKLKEMFDEEEIIKMANDALELIEDDDEFDSLFKSEPIQPKFEIQKRPKRLQGFTDKVFFTYGDQSGRAYVTVNSYNGEPWEVFISTKVKEVSSLAKALGLMTTKLLRLGGASDNVQQAIDTLTYDQTMGTLPYAIATILKEIQKEKLKKEMDGDTIVVHGGKENTPLMVFDSAPKKKNGYLVKCANCGEEQYDRVNCICYACGQSKCN